MDISLGCYHVAWCLCYRCCDIPQSHRSKRPFVKVLAIIPGPSEPHSMDPYVLPILEEFEACRPGTPGIRVHDMSLQQAVMHNAILSGIYGDTPASKKLQLWLGHSARLACGYCLLRGDNTSGTMRFLGYTKETECGPLAPYGRDGVLAKCGDRGLVLNDEQQWERADVVESVVNLSKRKALSLKVGLGYVIRYYIGLWGSWWVVSRDLVHCGLPSMLTICLFG